MKAKGKPAPTKNFRTTKARFKSRRLPYAKLSNEDLVAFVKNGWRVKSSTIRSVD